MLMMVMKLGIMMMDIATIITDGNNSNHNIYNNKDDDHNNNDNCYNNYDTNHDNTKSHNRSANKTYW